MHPPWWQAARTLVFPEGCLVCGGALETDLFCGPCQTEFRKCLGPQCLRCALPWNPVAAGFSPQTPCQECRKRPPAFDAAVAIGSYDGPLRTLCLQLKSQRGGWLAPRLIDLLLSLHQEPLERWRTEKAPASLPALVVPVPLHWSRRWLRGYNQAEALAKVLSNRLGLPMGKPLRRARRTPKLATLSRTERRYQLKNAFKLQRWSRHPVAGRDVILVDDILTTGATSNVAARVLKQGGVRRVYTLVLARAKEPR